MLKNNKESIFDFAKTIGIKNIGVCDAEFDGELFDILKKRRAENSECDFTNADLVLRSSPSLVLDGAKSVIVCLFPYYKQDFSKGNISRYAALFDYHKVALPKLKQIANFIDKNIEKSDSLCFCDTGASVDRFLAYKAGLGYFGKNNCLINDELGSYFFVGYIITTCDIEKDTPVIKSCLNCGKCIKSCPGGAIGEDFSFNPQKCVSYITQLKELTDEQESILKNQDSVYGCDICQETCPHNEAIGDTCMPEFLTDTMTNLAYNDLEQMSARRFKKEYDNFAFSWRGKDVILKNFVGGTYVKQRKNNG